ncbi:hypothetical protein SAMN04489761_4306 [Tenacibaculum sp. MAR_2009_124]|uniref:hypothetical protein n=1 Tax=Tenacibaculum sp. MAR_2009_124 TaxID=1250059 RepID=UPI00089CC677|nr:hypothetical protein [Tenacibaculum sp. MAR_2009_124]SED11053.1 hypothetical protein SAMN04489761_4306 [Tenacibaculum sp. MAR_2009_124]
MHILIGIDPDVEKSGVAFKIKDHIELSNLSFFDLFEFLSEKRDRVKKTSEEILIVVEAGWLNKSNWHKKKNGSAAVNAEIGKRTGANLETGKKIVEMVRFLKLPYKIIKPKTSKINSEFFKRITGIKRSNQEQRDAYMLIHGIR